MVVVEGQLVGGEQPAVVGELQEVVVMLLVSPQSCRDLHQAGGADLEEDLLLSRLPRPGVSLYQVGLFVAL